MDRSSEAEEPLLITDPQALAEKEAENALLQFDAAMEELDRWIIGKENKFRVSTILDLHRIALNEIHPYAGNFRPSSVAIKGSTHKPVAHTDVPRLVEEMCDYVNDHWDRKTAIHLASYIMWRLNWIHPFSDGNGRTARIVSYLALCAKLKTRLPGQNTIPEQIAQNKKPYYDALENADEYHKRGTINLTNLETLIEGYLATQLVAVHSGATGNDTQVTNTAIAEKPKGIIKTVESHPVIFTFIGTAIIAILIALLS